MTTIQKPEDLFSLFRMKHLFERFGLKKVGLFGSLARVLENETGYKVDMVQRKYAEPVILFRALKEIRYATA